jgi:hypothetical protein
MHLAAVPRNPRTPSPGEFLGLRFAYGSLLSAAERARRQRRRPHAKPVPLPCLRGGGAGDSLLRWLLFQGHVDHLRPCPGPGGEGLDPGVVQSVVLATDSSFALTPEGSAFAVAFLDAVSHDGDTACGAAQEFVVLGDLVPTFRQEGRVFLWGSHVLKCFRQPSGNQELVLRAAEELGWPTWFDDPLPRAPRVNAKARLHDTIKALNRNQDRPLIHFRGDGTGTRVGWQFRWTCLPSATPEVPQAAP